MALSYAQAIADARGAGWSDALIPEAVGTALTESTLDPGANNGNHFGLFQFDAPTASSVGYSASQVFDPQNAFRAAYLLYQKRGWEPWAPNEPAATRAGNIAKIRAFLGKGGNVAQGGGNPIPGADWLGGVLNTPVGNPINAAGDAVGGAASAAVTGAVGGMYELGRKLLPFIVILLGIIGVGFALIEEMGK